MDNKPLIDNLLLCVGAQKAGTTWLHRVLSASEDIEFSPRKEVHFFDAKNGVGQQLHNHFLDQLARQLNMAPSRFQAKIAGARADWISLLDNILDDEWYRSQFKSGRKYIADFTPEYALLPRKGFKHAKRLSRETRVIFIMRDPVERTLSAFRYFHQNRNVDIASMSNDEIRTRLQRDVFSRRSDYVSTVRKLDKCFGEEEVLYLFFEDLMADKAGGVTQICDFLDIEVPSLEPGLLDKSVNSSRQEAFSDDIYQFLEREYRKQKRAIRERFGRLPLSWGQSAV